jgi:hypothetical protein
MKQIQLSIPKPCHENWNEMTPQDQGRFCGACQKTVVDFSTMSDRQLAEFFKKPVSSVCGRFHADQLEREIVIPKKRIPWVKYFFTIALPAFLLSCKFAGRQAAQGKVISTEQHITGDTVAFEPANIIQGEPTLPPTDTLIVPQPPLVMGKLMLTPIDSTSHVDSAVLPIKFRPVKVGNKGRCKMQAIANDSLGFTKSPFRFQPVQLQVTEVDHSDRSLQSYIVGGLVSRISVKRKSEDAVNIKATKQTAPTRQASFSVFPNPVSANAQLKVVTKELPEGLYLVSVLSNTGSLIQQTSTELRKSVESFSTRIKIVSAGVYFIRMQQQQTGATYTQTIVVKE